MARGRAGGYFAPPFAGGRGDLAAAQRSATGCTGHARGRAAYAGRSAVAQCPAAGAIRIGPGVRRQPAAAGATPLLTGLTVAGWLRAVAGAAGASPGSA